MALNQNQKLALFIGLAGVGFLLWKKFGKKSAAPLEDSGEKNAEIEEKSADSGYSTYQLKVMKLQTLLKVGVDGIAGPITNKALAAAMPQNYTAWGAVSVSNIDKYLEAFGVKAADDAQKAISDHAAALVSAAKGGAMITMAQDYTAKEIVYDYSQKKYTATGAQKSFSKGTKFPSPWTIAQRNTTVLLKYDDQTGWWEFPPSALIAVK